MPTQSDVRTTISSTSSFVSVPGAFKMVPEGLRNAVKIEFRTAFSKDSSHPLKLETVASTDVILFDLAALAPSAVDAATIARDCELVREAALKNPGKLREIMEAFQPTAPASDWKKALRAGEELGLTEELTAKAGGGLLPLILLGVALLCSGCMAHCGGSVRQDKHP